MARLHDDSDPQHPLIEGGGPSTTEERVIGSLLEGLDAPQPVVRTRTGRRANASEPPPGFGANGDRQAPTALLPAVQTRQKRRATYIAAMLGIIAIVVAIAYVRQPAAKNENVTAAPTSTAADLSTNHQMNNSATAFAPTAPPTAPVTVPAAPMPTVSLSSLPSAPVVAAPERPHPAVPTARPVPNTGTGNHAEIREDQL